MSLAPMVIDLTEENRLLRAQIKGLQEDLAHERGKNLRAAEQHARMDLTLQKVTAELRTAKAKLERAGIR